MTDAQVTSSNSAGDQVAPVTAPAPEGGNPVAPAGTRTAADVVTPELVARLTRGRGGQRQHRQPHALHRRASSPTCPSRRPTTWPPPSSGPGRRSAAWAATPVRQRAAVLLRFHDLVLRRQAEVLDLIQLETGKARLHAHEEVQAVAVAARHYGAQGALLPSAQAAHRGHPGADQGHGTAPAARGRRPDRALELPAGAVDRRRAARLRGRQRGGDEAGHRDRADRAVGPRADDRGRTARRRSGRS